MEENIFHEIVKWVKYDDKIKEYNDKCKLLKIEKDKISEKILGNIDPQLKKMNYLNILLMH